MKFLLLFLAACSSELVPPEVERGPEEERARDLVWHGYFNSERMPPRVVWWYDICPISESDKISVYIDGECYAGLFRERMWRADVAWRGAFSESAYSHELLHAYQAERGIYDPEHENAEWEMVPIIDAELKEQGL